MPALGAAAAMKGGILSRALAGSRSFNGGYSSVYSGASKSNFRVTSTQAAKLYYVAFDGKLQQPDQEPIIDAIQDEMCYADECEYHGPACQKLGEHGRFYCRNCTFSWPELLAPMENDDTPWHSPPTDWESITSEEIPALKCSTLRRA